MDSLNEAIDLIDRFIDGRLRYPLEWDDFMSWTNSNGPVEQVRQEIAALERSFFSKDQAQRHGAVTAMVRLRNFHATQLRIPR